jgi:flagellar basal-body rod protein FlgF
LVTQEGDTVNSDNGFSITIPANEHVSIDKQGGVNIIQNGQLAVIDKLKLVSLPESYVFKGKNGMIQVDPDHAGGVKAAQGTPVLSGAIEESNVSPVDTLVRMMNISRQYEANISEISSEKKNDTSVNELLNVR